MRNCEKERKLHLLPNAEHRERHRGKLTGEADISSTLNTSAADVFIRKLGGVHLCCHLKKENEKAKKEMI